METQGSSSEETSADLVITNAKVITVDKDFSIREAVAVKDGRIATVGTDHDVQPFIGPDPRVLDLKGKAGDLQLAHENVNTGVVVSGSSDTPCTYPNWLLGVQAAVLRESWASGQVSGPDECITVEEAITMYTINGAWQDHMDTIKGSIEVGKLADLQVLGADILEVDPHVIGQIPVVMTIVGGKIVYSSANM